MPERLGDGAHASRIDAGRILDFAQRLMRAEQSCTTIALLSAGDMMLSSSAAYAIQRMGIALRGAKCRGWKLGYTSAAMREQMNISEPNYGVLTDAHFATEEDGRLDARNLVHPLVEPEIALKLGCDLAGPCVDVERALQATELLFLRSRLLIHAITNTHSHLRIILPTTVLQRALCSVCRSRARLRLTCATLT